MDRDEHRCACDHMRYDHKRPMVGDRWGRCEKPDCTCRAFHPADRFVGGGWRAW